MSRWIRRLLVLALLGAGATAFRFSRRPAAGTAPAVAPESTWPPFAAVEASPPDDAPDWLPPNADGSCPDGYPIKANDNSHIFHVPGGRSYERTKAERCYAEATAAERDGYRRAKA